MTQEVKLRRAQCNFQSENARFLLECDFTKQYNNYYQTRLKKTRPFLEFNCRSKWDPDKPIYNLSQLAEECMGSVWNDTDRMRLSPSSSPETPPNDTDGSFRFSKRLRKYSDNATIQSPEFKTSTQRVQLTPVAGTSTGNQFSLPIESPILPLDQQESKSSQYIIIGTIFKRMRLQPDIIRELSSGDFNVKSERYLGHYVSQEDRLVLEDVGETILLTGLIDPKKFVTGIVVALLGHPLDDGSQFYVQDICYAEPNRLILYDNLSQQQTTIERPLSKASNEPIYLMLVSGLGFHQDMGKSSSLTLALQNLIDFVWGGAKYENDKRSSQIFRILVLGDSLSSNRLVQDTESQIRAQKVDIADKIKESRQVKPYNNTIQATKNMDDFFAQLSKTINIDVMPGETDPSSHLFPQQPFHPLMFPKSCMFSTFNCTTNPYHAIYNGNVEILATSGQNVDIIKKFSGLTDTIEIMKNHLQWGNMAPSAPDNLYSAPYEDEDPFVIDFIPEIYVAGNQKSYMHEFYYYQSVTNESLIVKSQPRPAISRHLVSDEDSDLFNKSRTLLISVPKFCESFSCVLIDLKSLEPQLVSMV